jgi:hypothetical protein
MKTLKVLLLLLTVSTLTFAQNFEGKITYQNSYKSKIQGVTDEQFTSMMGTTQEYWIKRGNYKSTLNGSVVAWVLYVNKDNKLYSKMGNSEIVYWNDGSQNTNEITKAEINKEVLTILGYKCDELILTGKNGVEKYYFNSSLKIDASLFKNHKYGNWSEYTSRSNAVPLKMIIETPQFSMESTATEVKPVALEEQFFQLPPNTQTQKSPF